VDLTIEPIEGQDGQAILRIQLEDDLVGIDRLLGFLQLAVIDLRERMVHLLLLVDGGSQFRLLAIDVLEVLPALEPGVEPLERIDRDPVALIEAKDHLEHLDGVFRIVEPLQVDLRRLEAEGLLGLHVIDHLDLAQDDLDEPRVVLSAKVDRLEGVGRPDVAGVDLEHATVGRGGFREPDEDSKTIASHILEFLKRERKLGRLHGEQPYQSGVGNVANAVLGSAAHAPRYPRMVLAV